ncbi:MULTISPECIES: sugar ABC transporter substrate-binding protein [unclassified Meiothermus]|uniref:ABC transporter substrate-binding protein n=1 Tax=unclassified Meiothermus TaxID=370471 RepID=UPI000D7B9647|nr:MULTISPECIES: sugar ABC transporter substrate-binding protein [unclassified Meiothermus]PZA05867.1 sugar ABC transporter substrate-binding protein [Meiothermus sp. Pnk-1]RYM30737.1 sugar ABC transporter substrate-binding protein [Meiothermus sp. PNK-Is4]
MHQVFRRTVIAAVAALAAQAFAQTEITYWLWDSNQQPAYQTCANAFQKENPDIKVNIVQKGWDDYWTGLTTGFVSGTAPDVFTNHLAKYPEFASNGQIVDIAPLIKRDGVKTDIYYPGLYELWGRGGKQYGLPKDWDTIAIVYNKKLLKDAGISEATLRTWTWNPKDGGSFERVIAQLTKDKNGNNGLSKNFDPKNVVQYGFVINGSGGGYGQTEWSWLAVSNGFKFNDGPWDTKYYYDSPKLAETIQWLADLSLKKGYMVPISDVSRLGSEALFTSGKVAMLPHGSWMIKWFKDNAKFDVGFALLPIGPNGRKSMFNGLADSIWTGSKKQEQAWKWVKFLGSPACQNIVGSYGVVFPAIKSGVDAALQAHKKNGLDVSAFTTIANTKGATFLFPITDYASEISSIMSAAMDSIFLGKAKAADALKEANAKVNALFKR